LRPLISNVSAEVSQLNKKNISTVIFALVASLNNQLLINNQMGQSDSDITNAGKLQAIFTTVTVHKPKSIKKQAL